MYFVSHVCLNKEFHVCDCETEIMQEEFVDCSQEDNENMGKLMELFLWNEKSYNNKIV